MTLNKFKTEVRLNRGKLTNYDQELEDIYNLGIIELAYFTIEKKLMGIRNIAWVASQPMTYQEKFLKWMAEKGWKATANEIDLWTSSHDSSYI